jgi:hypothetical protein
VAVTAPVIGERSVVQANIAAEHATTVRLDVSTNVTRNVTAMSSQKFFFGVAHPRRVGESTLAPGRTPL